MLTGTESGCESAEYGHNYEKVKAEKEYRLEFMVNEETMDKINRARSLLSGRYPQGIGLELLFDTLLDSYLDRKDPGRRIKRVKKSKRGNRPGKGSITLNRHIPQEVKCQVYARDGGRCSFVGKTGRRCSSDWDLQYDHIVPFAKVGDNSPENLRLLCARHNQLMAEREYGREHMGKFRGDDT